MVRPLTAQDEEFRRIYARVSAKVVEQAARRNARRPPHRSVSVAHASVLDVPRETLLAIEDDAAFVASCYLVLVDRAPSLKETQSALERLREATSTRTEIFDEVTRVGDAAPARRRVNFT